jgi:LPS sulfotransferase NodH
MEITPLFLCFTNRSGSNALGEDIGFLDGCHFLEEALNFNVVIDKSIQNKYESFLEYLNGILLDQNFRIPIIKASYEQVIFLYRNGYFQYFFKNPKFIHIERIDLVGQAISLFIASHTKQWKSSQEASNEPPELVIEEIINIMNSISIQNSRLKTFFSLTRADIMHINYEQYNNNRLKILNRIIKFLGINSLPGILPAKKIKKQICSKKDSYKKTVIRHFKF